MSYLDTIRDKKSLATSKADAQATLDSLIGQLKEVQLASLMGNSKSTVILADSTDFGQKMAELGDKIMATLEAFKKDTKNADKLAEIADQYERLATYNVKSQKEQTESMKKTFDEMISSLKSIKMPEVPQVKIPAPIVNVPKNDFSPITKAISEIKEEKGIDLNDYHALDILEDGKTQYIGFQNTSGSWYIIESKENKLRYVFGHGGYAQAFKKAASYQYELLSEAINAL